MFDQAFSQENLMKLLTKSHLFRYNFGQTDEERKAGVQEASNLINQTEFSFSAFKVSNTTPAKIFLTENLQDDLAQKKLADNLKRLHLVTQANRSSIIAQIKTLLTETTPMSIVKLDIKQFYEQIDKGKVMKIVLDDHRLSYQSRTLLIKFFQQFQMQEINGLPRGISISAVLSEIYMKEFDTLVRKQPGVYFYARYVDDIIVFTFKSPRAIVQQVELILDKTTSLKLNRKKTKIIERVTCRCRLSCTCGVNNCKCVAKCNCKYEPLKRLTLEYLGYQFKFSDIAKSSNVTVGLAHRKIKKIKSRIVAAFLAFLKDRDFLLLNNRIKFLTGNFIAKQNSAGKINAGIYYNYHHLTEEGLSDLSGLTGFLMKLLTSKRGSLRTVSVSLTLEQRTQLARYCFKSGYLNRRLSNFTLKQISQIKKCWIYDY
jgi:hypothetical protein